MLHGFTHASSRSETYGAKTRVNPSKVSDLKRFLGTSTNDRFLTLCHSNLRADVRYAECLGHFSQLRQKRRWLLICSLSAKVQHPDLASGDGGGREMSALKLILPEFTQIASMARASAQQPS
jgi:hypothetical protein